jgi:hypothetical protein
MRADRWVRRFGGGNVKTLAPPPLRQPLFANLPAIAHPWQAWFSDIKLVLDAKGAAGDFYTKIQADARFAAIVHTHNASQITDFSTAVQTIGDARYARTVHNHDGSYALASHRHAALYNAGLIDTALAFDAAGDGLFSGSFKLLDNERINFGSDARAPFANLHYDAAEREFIIEAPGWLGGPFPTDNAPVDIVIRPSAASGSVILEPSGDGIGTVNIRNLQHAPNEIWTIMPVSYGDSSNAPLYYRTKAELRVDIGAEATGTAAGLMTAHVAAVDPHTGYVLESGSLTQIATRNHNDLQSLQGGTAGQYNHLTNAQVAALHAAITVTDSSSIDFTLTGQALSASAIFGTTAGTVCQGNDGRLSDSRPASDVYAWAKAATKPTYTYAEVGADIQGAAGAVMSTLSAHVSQTTAAHGGIFGGGVTTGRIAGCSGAYTLGDTPIYYSGAAGNVGIGIAPTTSGNYRVLAINGTHEDGSGGLISFRNSDTEQANIFSNSGGIGVNVIGDKGYFVNINSKAMLNMKTTGLTVGAAATTSTTIGAKDSRIVLVNDSGTVGAGGEIVFAAADANIDRYAAIGSAILNNSAAGATGRFYIATKANTADTALTERFTISSAGVATVEGTRKIVLDPAGIISLFGGGAAWANGHLFHATDGTLLGGLYAYGTTSALQYFNVGAVYNDLTLCVKPGVGVGIGIVPTSPLHLYSTSVNGAGIVLQNSTASGSYTYGMLMQAGSTGFSVADWANALVLESNTAGGLVLSSYNQGIKFQTNRLTKLTIGNTGYVNLYGPTITGTQHTMSFNSQDWLTIGHAGGWHAINWWCKADGTKWVNTHATVRAAQISGGIGSVTISTSPANSGAGADAGLLPRLTVDYHGYVGIANTNPSALSAYARDIAVGDGTGDRGITLYSATTRYGSLYFADGVTGDQASRGFIQYYHNSDSLFIGTAGLNALTISNVGDLTVETGGSSPVRIWGSNLPNYITAGAELNLQCNETTTVTMTETDVTLQLPTSIVGDASVFGALTASGAFGCNGAAAQGKATVRAAATDLATALTLVNQLRTMAINNGMAV